MSRGLDPRIQDPRVAKLPQWAQEKIRLLESDLFIAKNENRQFRAGQFGDEGSNTRLKQFGDEPVMLTNHGQIEFQTDPEDEHSVIRVRVTRKGTININGQGQLLILPCASNDIEVTHLD